MINNSYKNNGETRKPTGLKNGGNGLPRGIYIYDSVCTDMTTLSCHGFVSRLRVSGGSCSPPSTPQCPPLPLPGMAMDPDAPEWLDGMGIRGCG